MYIYIGNFRNLQHLFVTLQAIQTVNSQQWQTGTKELH